MEFRDELDFGQFYSKSRLSSTQQKITFFGFGIHQYIGIFYWD
jgi:hypothetical protein